MVDNNIIQALNAGSGIDTNSLVSQLTAIERAAPQQRIDTKRELAETQISDFGILSSALATLQDAAEILTDPEGLFSKTASFTESDALIPTTLSTDVPVGSYAFTVSQVAQSQSIGFTGFSDPTDAVGEGTLTFNFGAWARDSSTNDINGDFTQDASQASTTITIDSTNNSLNGLRDAINEAEMGVTASIVFDGTDYRLTLLADSGEQNQLEIVVAESGSTPTNTDSSDLSRFAFNGDIDDVDLNSTETQHGQDAILTINGLSVSRSSNTVDDVVEGLTLDLLKATETDPAEVVTVTVSNDTAYAEQNVRAFVEAYNLFLETLEPIFGTSEVEDSDGNTTTVTGSLANDGLAKSALTQIRTLIASAVTGLSEDESSLTSLTNIGIRTELDGTLSINEEDFTNAFENNFEDVQKLLAPFTSSSSSEISINSFNDNTTAGEYSVVIDTLPTQGAYAGGAFDGGITFPLDTTGKTYTFVAEVNGNTTGTITIPEDTYASEADLAAAIQSAINADTTLQENNASVTVSYNSSSGGFDISSSQYGGSSNVNISSTSGDLQTDLGITDMDGTAGTAAGGTVDGVTGFGSANVLLPALGESAEGLALIIGDNATSATVNFSRGFAGELELLIDNFLASTGPIAEREDTLNAQLEGLDDDQDALDRRISSYEERLIQQYINMESIINALNSSSSFLDNLINTLPFTAGDN